MPPFSSRGGQEAANQSSCFLSHNHHHWKTLETSQLPASVETHPSVGRLCSHQVFLKCSRLECLVNNPAAVHIHLKCTVVQPCPLESWSQQSRSAGLVLTGSVAPAALEVLPGQILHPPACTGWVCCVARVVYQRRLPFDLPSKTFR